MDFIFGYVKFIFLVNFFLNPFYSKKFNFEFNLLSELFTRNYKETILVDVSLNQISEDSKSESSESLVSFFSLESFQSCFSEFQSQSSYESALGNDLSDSGQTPCEYEFTCTPSEIFKMINEKNFKKLKKVKPSSISKALDKLNKEVEVILGNYNKHTCNLEATLSQFNLDRAAFKEQIDIIEKELESIIKRANCYLNYYDYHMFFLFKLLFSTKVKRFESATKQFRTSLYYSKLNDSQRKIAFQSELLSLLSNAFTYYFCEHSLLNNLRLCKFIKKKYLKATQGHGKAIKSHEKAIESHEKAIGKFNTASGAQELSSGEKKQKKGLLSRTASRVTRVFRNKSRR
ncbi:uncharacterized protein ELE39_000948 [Cryptosporidium sp. chipmunk genotype I]|uniref:uncharacterized protein n=1 Tax=Cryptosporidium sp. chipmunk genotype I TaxID=1280935 RepID=UPI00351A2DD6|nr:hypothetical protein ELE39_000948 [Cryptosporidium sp. chipmunk genotype I]